MGTARPPNLSELLHSVASTCLSSPCNGLPLRHHLLQSPEFEPSQQPPPAIDAPGDPGEITHGGNPAPRASSSPDDAALEAVALMEEVFDAVGAVKRAYARLQDAHSPWDPEKMRSADEAVVAELRKLARLKERYRRGRRPTAALPLVDAVAPYEAALDEARREIRAKEEEVEALKERIRCGAAAAAPNRRKHMGKKSPSAAPPPEGAPTPALFETWVSHVTSASKSFTGHLLSLMRSSQLDVAAAVRSIVDDPLPLVGTHHAKHALASYIHRKLFHGFEDESFYMDGSLSSLLNPAQHRRDCYVRFSDMRCMDPAQLLGVLPDCAFGKWAGRKYLSIVSAEMEGLLFRGSPEAAEQRRVVEGGGHPRTGFYGEYLRVAKAVWMLHLLKFALDPGPSLFEAIRGSDYQVEHMESVIRFPGGGVPSEWVVGFSVAPGFRLGNGSVVRARVYPVPRAPV